MAGDPPGPELGCGTGDRLDVYVYTHDSFSSCPTRKIPPSILASPFQKKVGVASRPLREWANAQWGMCILTQAGGRQLGLTGRVVKKKRACVKAGQSMHEGVIEEGDRQAEPGGSEGIEGYAYSEGSSEAKRREDRMVPGDGKRRIRQTVLGNKIARQKHHPTSFNNGSSWSFDISTKVPRPIIPVRHGV